jgi:hypothetical protein
VNQANPRRESPDHPLPRPAVACERG